MAEYKEFELKHIFNGFTRTQMEPGFYDQKSALDPLMDPNEKVPLLDKKAKDKTEPYLKISKGDIIIRYGSVVVFACAMVMGDVSKAQYIYKWISTNADLPEDNRKVDLSKINNTEHCATNASSEDEDAYQKLATEWALYLTLTERGIALPVLTFFGIYSDLIGRKPLIIVSTLACALKYGTLAFFIFKDFDIKFLFISYAVSGLGGSGNTFYLGYLAGIADTTSRSKTRSFTIAFLDAVNGISASIAQIATGYIIHSVGYFFLSLLVSGILFLLCIFSIFFFKETHSTFQSKSLPTNISWNLYKALKQITGFYTHKEQRRNMPLSRFLFIYFAFIPMYTVFSSRSDIEVLYSLNYPFCWSSVKIGYYRAGKDIIQMCLGVMLVKLFHLCTSDEIISLFGCVSAIATFIITAFASKDWMLYIAAVIGILCILPLPLIRGMLSKTIQADKQGALFANIYVVETVCTICGVIIFNNIYAQTQGFMEGLTFLVMAGLCLIPAIFLILCLRSVTVTENTTVNIQGAAAKSETTNEIMNCDDLKISSKPAHISENEVNVDTV